MQQVIIKGNAAPSWYISNGIHKRVVTQAHAAVLVYIGLAVFGDGGTAAVLDQAIVNAIVTV